MKYLILAFSLFFFDELLPPQAPVVWQSDATFDFGNIPQGKPVQTIFTFRNTGTDSLFIDNVRTDCGCTTPDWEEVLIPPDSLGYIRIEYDADDEGYFHKWIRVYFNGYRKAERLWIEGQVDF
ncbi:MAG: DUF1573 domain-containing protein [Saprospiraceae bacterium]